MTMTVTRWAFSPGKVSASFSVMLTVISPAHSGGGEDVPALPDDDDDDDRSCSDRHPHGTAIATVRPSSDLANIGPSSPKLCNEGRVVSPKPSLQHTRRHT